MSLTYAEREQLADTARRIQQAREIGKREDERLMHFLALHDGAVEYQVLSGADQERAERLVRDGVLRFSGRYVVRNSVPVDDFGAPVTVAPDFD